MIAYFAYGSNMASVVMQARCPSARARGAARLPGFRLAFRLPSQRWGDRAADVVPDAGERVWGVLWEISPVDLTALDAAEAAYVRSGVSIVVGGAPRPAVTYVLRPERAAPDPGAPAPAYLGHMIAGAREHGLPEDWINRLERLAAG